MDRNDARTLVPQPLQLRRLVARHLVRIEPIKSFTESLALAQDGDPRQARLEAIELQFLKQRP